MNELQVPVFRVVEWCARLYVDFVVRKWWGSFGEVSWERRVHLVGKKISLAGADCFGTGLYEAEAEAEAEAGSFNNVL